MELTETGRGPIPLAMVYKLLVWGKNLHLGVVRFGVLDISSLPLPGPVTQSMKRGLDRECFPV